MVWAPWFPSEKASWNFQISGTSVVKSSWFAGSTSNHSVLQKHNDAWKMQKKPWSNLHSAAWPFRSPAITCNLRIWEKHANMKSLDNASCFSSIDFKSLALVRLVYGGTELSESHSVILRQLLQLMCLACLAIIGQGKIVNWRPWQSRTKTMVQKEIRMLVIPQAMPNALVVSYYPRGRHFFYPTLGTLKNREEESHQVLGGDMLDFGR